ncbi:mitochondrial distribution and morphology protein family 31/32 [Daedalea quercina L-15889]|uniref:Mitochondrial distribution and morphology protein family 31/32 n=1 Tax=Daedalea quercina L-15889 TaxID=1314783 RepID=A0A165N095_9APHY|nr:mitochondrial distribution and morphology protein family 31/32 [Daedalea quercina L-15889]
MMVVFMFVTFHGPATEERSNRARELMRRQGRNRVSQKEYDNYPPFFRRLALSLPTHRPTREDFLNAANGFWQRARVRFRWLTIRSFRRYNADDISAFVTWFFMSQTIWLFIGTTTFFSVIFATINSLRLQEYVARAISDYLTSETGITIIFESAIVPKWKDSRISFKNVYIIRGPHGPEIAKKRKSAMSNAHKVAVGYDVSNHPSFHGLEDEDEDEGLHVYANEDVDYSMFDLSVDSIDVTLSFARWWQGKGLIADAVIKGVRGVLDRRSVKWDPDHPLDPALFRHEAHPGDFELESLQIEDLLLTVYQPGNFRPFTASIFRADIGTFRKQWLFYDFLAAENVVGQYDNCLFSLHRPQSIGRTTEQDLQDGQWARMSRFRMDGLNIDQMQAMTTEEGPFSWLTSGKVDAVFDIKFPRGPTDELQINALLGELADAISTAASSVAAERIPGQRELAKPPLSVPSDRDQVAENSDMPQVVIDIDLRFRDLKAAVPIFTNELSYVNNALVRPIVAFMNANRTLVPIRCRVVQPLSDFEGSWTLWETGLMDIIALKVYEAMAYHVAQANFNRRLKVVSAWSLQMTTSAVISALRTLIDPVATHLRELYDQGAYEALIHPPEGPLTA